MKIKVISNKNYEQITKELIDHGIEVSNDSNLVLIDEDSYLENINGELDKEKTIVPVNEVIYIESFGHDLFIHQLKDNKTLEVKISGTLDLFEATLNPKQFIRINISMIVNKKMIKEIKPTLQQKFKLILVNGKCIEVTRTYYYKFKEMFKI